MPMEDLFRLVRNVTVAQMLGLVDFSKRMAASEPISLLELLYPVLQGYDSVAVRADVELGGTDQKFNLLLGRDIQRAYDVPEQAILTMPLLVGTDGERKMSKSYGNHVGVTDAPEEMYGKVMSVPDGAMAEWYPLLLGRPQPAEESPRDAKRALAKEIVARYHGPDAAAAAEAHFDRVFVARELPDDMPEADFDGDPVHLPALLEQVFGVSRSEARRLMAQGGVRIGADRAADADVPAASLDG